MRAAFYARYSSDLQNRSSIDDQLRLLRERCAREGWTPAGTYSDAAISGSTLLLRPGVKSLLEDAAAGRFDVVLCEALDRLSRDQADVATLWKRLKFAGARIVTLSEGEVGELHIGFSGTINAIYLKDLGAKVRRGQRGTVERGRIPGGISYGYKAVHRFGDDGEPMRGLRAVDEAEAAVIRRIFAEFAKGLSARAIAARLNAEQIPAPRGGPWNASSINGNHGRRNGILNNELFRGRIVYNRQTFLRNPETGKRAARKNPPEAWIAIERPELRIVDEEAWAAVQAFKERNARRAVHHRRRPKHLLAGMLRCAACGGAYTMRDATRLCCCAHRERGTCANAVTIRRDELERRVIGGLKTVLLLPELVGEIVRDAQAQLEALIAGAAEERRAVDRAATQLDGRIRRLVDAIADGVDTPAMRKDLVRCEAERAEIDRQRAQLDDVPMLSLDPGFAGQYRARIEKLGEALAEDPLAAAEAAMVLRELVEKIVLHPDADAGTMQIELHGSLAGVLALIHGHDGTGKKIAATSQDVAAMMVAGGGSVHYPHAPPLVIWL